MRRPSAASATGMEARRAETRYSGARCVARQPGPVGGSPLFKRRDLQAGITVSTPARCSPRNWWATVAVVDAVWDWVATFTCERGVRQTMWINQSLKVYHGCDDLSAKGIVKHGIQLASGSPTTDFGQGFYTTTNVHQAEQWANRRYQLGKARRVRSAAVVEFKIDRNDMAGLDDMAFVREDFAPNSDYWQLVAHCRGGNDHARQAGTPRRGYYDVVYGPVSLYPQFLVIADADQISFHTQKALNVLKDAEIISRGSPEY